MAVRVLQDVAHGVHTSESKGVVRGVDGDDAEALLGLHRELWIDHDERGGMPSSRDELIWAAYGDMLSHQVAHRRGRRRPEQVFEGKLGHLVVEPIGTYANAKTSLSGQVEIYLDRYGFDAATPHVAELRSLIVHGQHRGAGYGAQLVRAAAKASRDKAMAPTVIVAEVLARNDALTFYDRLGFRSLERVTLVSQADSSICPPSANYSFSHPTFDGSVNSRIHGTWDASMRNSESAFSIRRAGKEHAFEVATLDLQARARRHQWGDPRYDAAAPFVTTALVKLTEDLLHQDLIGSEVGRNHDRLRGEWIATDASGAVCAVAHLSAHELGIPFAPIVRAEIARVAANPDPRGQAAALCLISAALERAQQAGAVDLLVRTPFMDPLGERLAKTRGARPFSWILGAPSSQVCDESLQERSRSARKP